MNSVTQRDSQNTNATTTTATTTTTTDDAALANVCQRLSQWIHCICVVTFDLELGQAMEVNIIAINCTSYVRNVIFEHSLIFKFF